MDPAAIARSFVDEEEVRAVQRGHLRHFRGARRVLDLGCGRGTFLGLLREAGIEGLGVDRDPAPARAAGHEVVEGEVEAFLHGAAARGERFDGVFASHLVEHLPADHVPGLVERIAAVLSPGGRVVLVTPNARNLVVLTETFWLDPTHVRPWPRPLLGRLGEAAGLRVIESYDDRATLPRRSFPRRLLARIRSVLSGADRSGPMDSVVVMGRP
ncbi:MAG: class I SAM-dependent methyltransferase [Planctomycetes bacterium]|jgi:O-antigen chain-terminating methyltransferase|nr:class I SAM-dependent methyltransferase [Planctomycetota bacterium]